MSESKQSFMLPCMRHRQTRGTTQLGARHVLLVKYLSLKSFLQSLFPRQCVQDSSGIKSCGFICFLCKWRISLSGAGIISQDQRNKPFAPGVSEEPEIKLRASFRRKPSVRIISSWLPVTAGREERQPSFNPGPRTKEYCGCW